MSNGTNTNETSALVNRYTMTVDINGFKYDHHDGTSMQYQEVCDYLNNKYPVRVLRIEIPYVDVHAILHTERQEKNGQKLYDVNIMVKPLDDESFQNKPFVDGKFKAILRDNDTENDISESLEDENRMLEKDNSTYQVPMVFYLYRDEELNYNQLDVNMVANNPTLTQLWLTGFHMANPTLKAVVSKFDHNPKLGMMVIPPMDYSEFMNYLETEFGLYTTDYMDFIEHGVYFLLNRNNNANVSCPSMEYKVNIYVGRKVSERTDRFVTKVDDNTYDVNVSSSDISFVIENVKSFGVSAKYVYPSGDTFTNDKGLSRQCDLIYKTTTIPHIEKLKNTVYERCELSILDNSLNFITPLSKVTINNSSGIRNTYRLLGKQLTLTAGRSCKSILKCYRLVENV